MSKSITQEEAEKRSLDVGVKMVGKYINTRTKTTFECTRCNKIFETTPNHIWSMSTKSCGCMSGFQSLSQDTAIRKSVEVGVKMVGYYYGDRIKTKFECPFCKSIFDCIPKNIWNKNTKSCGCRKNKILYPVNNNYFDVWTSNMAYILGFTMADAGLIYHIQRSGNKYPVLVYDIKDREILEFIQSQICPTKPINHCVRTNNEFSSYRLSIPLNTHAVNKLNGLYIVPRKTGIEKCPNNIPKKYIGDYFRGIFDGDGCIYLGKKYNKDKTKFYHTKCFSIVSASQKFLIDLNDYICNIGHIYTRKKNNFCRTIYTLSIHSEDSLKYIYNFMYNNNHFCLQRKKNIFNKVIALCKNT
jgi:hypothetical protein